MTEVERIARQVDLAYVEGFWGGGSVHSLFRSFAPEEAAAHPVPNAHSAWEIALHLTIWHDAFRRRLAGEVVEYGIDNADWPESHPITAAKWKTALEELDKSHENLVRGVLDLNADQLDQLAPGKPFTIYEMLHGAGQHDQYHAGQVMILRKALGSSQVPA